jgi:addiction module HigA family antidote
MAKPESLQADVAIHPGDFLREELEARGMSQRELARRMGRPSQAINEIVHGKKTITAVTAVELEAALGISADYWMNLRTIYELTLARRERAAS